MKKLIWTCLLSAFAIAGHAAAYHNRSTLGFIDLLYWQVRENGADNWAQIINAEGDRVIARIVDAPFDWNTGLRIGINRQLEPDNFDITLAYTHYQTTASNQAAGTVASAFDGGYFVNNTDGSGLGLTYNSANVRWQFFYNTIDLNLGRHFEVDAVFQWHPYVGLKAATINQYIYTNWFNPTTPTNFTSAAENLKNDFTGLGPTLGVDTTWPMYVSKQQSLNLTANIASGLLWGHWHFNEVFTNNTPVTITTHVQSVNGASPVTTGLLGLQWIKHFAASDISIRLGYEAQIWFNQLQFYSLSMGRMNKPVSIQGGNLDVQYNF